MGDVRGKVRQCGKRRIVKGAWLLCEYGSSGEHCCTNGGKK